MVPEFRGVGPLAVPVVIMSWGKDNTFGGNRDQVVANSDGDGAAMALSE